VHGVPDPSPRPLAAVLFDFHGTIAQVEDPVDWVLAAAASRDLTLERATATALADRLVTAGRAGGPRPARIPPQLAEVFAHRDLSPDNHRAAYVGLAATVREDLAEALYERLLIPAGWRAFADTLPTLEALWEAAIPVGVVSNIGFDIREICDALGFARYVSCWALSYEVGCCKPDPAIFRYACQRLGVDPEETLMVGDSPADAAAVDAGCSVLVVPSGPPGSINGLAGALSLALPR